MALVLSGVSLLLKGPQSSAPIRYDPNMHVVVSVGQVLNPRYPQPLRFCKLLALESHSFALAAVSFLRAYTVYMPISLRRTFALQLAFHPATDLIVFSILQSTYLSILPIYSNLSIYHNI